MSATAEAVRLRPAQAEDFGPALAGELLHATDPHIFGYMHAHDEARAVRHLGHHWGQSESLFSHVHAVVAEFEGEAVAFELGFERATQDAHTLPFVRVAQAFLSESEFGELARWFEYGGFVIPPVPGDAYYLQNLAAVPAARGRGIGERLLEDCFERARAAGHGRVQLDVYDGNPAQRLYERVGMRTIVETRVNALEADGIGVHLRMEIRF